MMNPLKVLKNSKKGWAVTRGVMLGSIFSLSLLASVSTATAVNSTSVGEHAQIATYQLYAGGIHAVEVALNMEYKPQSRYSIEMDAFTKGFLGKLVPWKGKFESHGWRMKDEDKPEMHQSTTTWKDEVEIKTYKYNKDGTFDGLKITEDGVDKSPEELDQELVDGTTDALTAAMLVLQNIAEGESCDSSSEVFDGKRRYKMIFTKKADEMLKQTKYNVYEGPSIQCEVEVKPVAGEWHKKPRGWESIQEQGRERGSLPTIWIAKIDEKGPAVPVKMRVKTDYGTLFMHMTEYKSGDKVLHSDEVQN
ncbi:MAG TPA: DUF3108 domain-containing protein [Micavibrio sp.]|nr:DUF3108 domain-containing protein [Micavibrio sp.]HIL29573.1 DUF3108 domain-containing protein [Micavibrio sp.]